MISQQVHLKNKEIHACCSNHRLHQLLMIFFCRKSIIKRNQKLKSQNSPISIWEHSVFRFPLNDFYARNNPWTSIFHRYHSKATTQNVRYLHFKSIAYSVVLHPRNIHVFLWFKPLFSHLIELTSLEERNWLLEDLKRLISSIEI